MFNESKRSNNKLFPFVFSTSKVQTPLSWVLPGVGGMNFDLLHSHPLQVFHRD